MSDVRCKCGSPYQSTAGASYSSQYSLNGEIIYATCEHGYVVVDKRDTIDGTIRFNTCETPIYRFGQGV